MYDQSKVRFTRRSGPDGCYDVSYRGRPVATVTKVKHRLWSACSLFDHTSACSLFDHTKVHEGETREEAVKPFLEDYARISVVWDFQSAIQLARDESNKADLQSEKYLEMFFTLQREEELTETIKGDLCREIYILHQAYQKKAEALNAKCFDLQRAFDKAAARGLEMLEENEEGY